MSDSPLPVRPWSQRLWLAALAVFPGCIVFNGRLADIHTYFGWHQAIWGGRMPYRDVPFEYPPLALLPILAPGPLVATVTQYAACFMASMWLCDVAQKVVLWRAIAPARRAGAMAAQTAIAACLYFTYLKRFDVCVATVVAVAVARLVGRPESRGAWAWWGAAVACKLFPIFLAPSMLLHGRARGVAWRRLALQAMVGAAAAGLPLALAYAVAGPASTDWLGYHRARGLHVGSTYVSAMLARCGLGSRFVLAFRYGALHLVAPWADRAARVADVLLPLSAAATALAMARPARRARPGPPAPADLARACCAVLVAVLATGKVLSPQFIAWLVPLGVLAAYRSPRRDWVLLLAVGSLAALTAQTFPGEHGLSTGVVHRQAALVARGLLLWVVWAYLLATPRGLARVAARPERAELGRQVTAAARRAA